MSQINIRYENITMTEVPETCIYFKDDWVLSIENSNCNCSHAEIDSLIHKRILNPIDLEIMVLLARFKYVNLYNINYYLNMTDNLGMEYKKNGYKKNLLKLMKAGIVIRHSFTKPFITEETLANRACSSLRFYDLSPSAYSYIAPSIDDPHSYTLASSPTQKVELLALNQSLIHLIASYPNASIIQYLKNRNKKTVLLDAAIELPCKRKNEGSRLFFCFIPIRRSKDWIKHSLSRLELTVLGALPCMNFNPNPFLFLIVQDFPMMVDIYINILSQSPSLQLLNFYFLLDSMIIVQPLFDSIYICSNNNNMVTIKRTKLVID